jgi:hypothetical protein
MYTLTHIKFACIRAIAHTSLYMRTSPYFSPTTQPNLLRDF